MDDIKENKLLTIKNKETHPPLVRDAISIIELNFAFLYGIEELAEQLEVTKPHLIRTFTAHVGFPPGKYLTDIRIENSKSMLRSSHYTNLEMIATACGFSCANYFSKVFKRHTQQTPMEYARGTSCNLDCDSTALQRLYL